MIGQAGDLDTISFDVGEVARMAGVEAKTVANWTDRGFADPYQGSWEWKRGRGRARRYSLRDALRFALMGELAGRYQIPIPLGRRICGAIFAEGFSADHPGYLIVQGATADDVATVWSKDEQELAARLAAYPMPCGLVVNTRTIYSEVKRAAEKVLGAR